METCVLGWWNYWPVADPSQGTIVRLWEQRRMEIKDPGLRCRARCHLVSPHEHCASPTNACASEPLLFEVITRPSGATFLPAAPSPRAPVLFSQHRVLTNQPSSLPDAGSPITMSTAFARKSCRPCPKAIQCSAALTFQLTPTIPPSSSTLLVQRAQPCTRAYVQHTMFMPHHHQSTLQPLTPAFVHNHSATPTSSERSPMSCA